MYDLDQRHQSHCFPFDFRGTGPQATPGADPLRDESDIIHPRYSLCMGTALCPLAPGEEVS